MGSRGPAPRREEARRRRNEPDHPIDKSGPDELQALPFEVDLNPAPPEPSEWWHDSAVEFWMALQRDPARKWMTSADWAMAKVVCESISRDLSKQVVGITEAGGVVKDFVPLKGANLASYLKFMGMIGVTEAERLRMQKEITLHPPHRPEGVAVVVDIDTARQEGVQ